VTAEHTRIAWLRDRLPNPPPPSLGIGDDAAVIVGEGPVVATVDAAVERVHFQRDWCTLAEASARAIEAAASDVAAMGGCLNTPGTGLLLAWTLPRDFADEDFLALLDGAAHAARRLGTWVLGGNLSAGPTLSLTTTVLGRLPGRRIDRAGALPGDALLVSHTPGLAGLGLEALQRNLADDPRLAAVVAAWRRPKARLDLAAEVSRVAHAAIDLSDGLGQDAAHLARASGVALTLDAHRLRALPGLWEPAAVLSCDPVQVAVTGGEDYALLVTGPADAFGPGWQVVGEVTAGEGVFLRTDGATQRIDNDPTLGGFDHFRG